jgi:hypothetical protein
MRKRVRSELRVSESLTVGSVAPEIANVVYQATGKRVRDLPIIIEVCCKQRSDHGAQHKHCDQIAALRPKLEDWGAANENSHCRAISGTLNDGSDVGTRRPILITHRYDAAM